MKTTTSLLFVLLLPLPLLAQDGPPAGFAAGELDRSRACVPALERSIALDVQLEPLVRRAERIRALALAVDSRDPSGVLPLDGGDPIEEAVRQWFATDGELALREGAAGDAAVAQERSRGLDGIQGRLEEVVAQLSEEARVIVDAAGDTAREALTDTQGCEGAILVRSAVLEACGGATGVVCEAAKANEPGGRLRFVEAPEDLWDIEEMRPWSEPARLRLTPEGLAGARTATLVRRGNLVLVVSLEPMLLERSRLTAEQIAEFDANLQFLGFTFDDPRFVMAPGLGVQFDATARLGGATHYFLHFGDLSDPENDVIWTADASGPLQTVFPAPAQALARLAEGELLSLTAVTFETDDPAEGEALFTLELTPVGQSQAVGTLLSYMAGGEFARDLQALATDGAPGGH